MLFLLYLRAPIRVCPPSPHCAHTVPAVPGRPLSHLEVENKAGLGAGQVVRGRCQAGKVRLGFEQVVEEPAVQAGTHPMVRAAIRLRRHEVQKHVGLQAVRKQCGIYTTMGLSHSTRVESAVGEHHEPFPVSHHRTNG